MITLLLNIKESNNAKLVLELVQRLCESGEILTIEMQ
jgi:hypothetical protein